MKEQDPFNPAMPADFKLLPEQVPTEQNANPGINADFAAGTQETGRKSSRSSKRSTAPRTKKKSRISWQQMRNKLNAKLGGLDREKLKTVLVACGIAGGVVAAVILAAKLVPVAILLLALLGLAVVIKIWDRLRRMPTPTC